MRTSIVWILILFFISGCEMSIGIPKSSHAPKNVKPVKIQVVEGRTPLELLQVSQKNVETISYPDWGSYVSRIGKVSNEIDLGPDGRYWVLYVNGERVKEGTDRIRLKGNETVEFRFEKPKP